MKISLFRIRRLLKYTSESEVKKLLTPLGFKCIGSGCYSAAFSHPHADFVIKVSYDDYSMFEFKKFTDKIKKIFLPVIWKNKRGTISIAPKASKISDQIHYDDYKVIRETIKEMARKLGVALQDLHDGNFGLFNGRWYVIDYGCYDNRKFL